MNNKKEKDKMSQYDPWFLEDIKKAAKDLGLDILNLLHDTIVSKETQNSEKENNTIEKK